MKEQAFERAVGAVALRLAIGVTFLGACSFDFDGYDPRQRVVPPCVTGETIPCYEGPADTEGVGRCRAGVSTCVDGAFGPCEGAVLPEPERCDTQADDDCDGTSLDSEEGCICIASQEGACYEGPAGTLGVGACREGVGRCDPSGTAIEGLCLGQVLPVGESCASPSDDDCDGVANDWCTSWHRRFAGATTQRPLALDLSGGMIGLGGTFGDETSGDALTFDLGGPDHTSNGLLDMFVAVLDDSDGSHRWSRSFGGTKNDAIHGVAIDERGDLYAVGSFEEEFALDEVLIVASSPTDRDAFVLKLDGVTGDTIWHRIFTGAGLAEATSIAVGGGKVVVGGSFDGTVTFDTGVTATATATDAFVVALDAASGSHDWHQVIGGINDDVVLAVDLDDAGGVIAGGEYDEPIDFGEASIPDANSQGAFLLRLAPDGTPDWIRAFDGVGNDRINSVRHGPDGRIYVAGAGLPGIDFGDGATDSIDRDAFVACFSATGELAWADVLVVEGPQEAFGVDAAPDGSVVAAVSMTNHAVVGGLLYPASKSDTWLMVQYDPDGVVTRARLFGDHSDQDLRHARFHGTGVLLAGDCYGEMDFGDGPPSISGAEGICIAKLEP